MTDGILKSNESNTTMSDVQKEALRLFLVQTASKLLGIPYQRQQVMEPFGIGKWIDLSKLPDSLDCSGLTEGVYHYCGLKLPHGSQNQFNETIALAKGKEGVGDLAFFGRDKDITRIYHVGMVFDQDMMIEARDLDRKASFITGQVIVRPKEKWENWENFVGYRCHPKLA